MNFLEKFKERIRAIDSPEVVMVTPKKEERPTVVEKAVKLFNIYKRSLPPGLDKVVVFNVTKEEAEMLLEHISAKHKIRLLGEKVYHDDARDSKTIVYYDIIPADAKPHERNIYFNPPETRQPRYDDPPQWVG